MKESLYVTYCSKSKLSIPEGIKVAPSELYISSRIQAFVSFCITNNYQWAIFSDMYGLVFQDEKISWYNKAPDSVSDEEYKLLLTTTLKRIAPFDVVRFYYQEESFHPLYKRLIDDLQTYRTVESIDMVELI